MNSRCAISAPGSGGSSGGALQHRNVAGVLRPRARTPGSRRPFRRDGLDAVAAAGPGVPAVFQQHRRARSAAPQAQHDRGAAAMRSSVSSPTDLPSARIMAMPTRLAVGARTGRNSASRPSSRPISWHVERGVRAQHLERLDDEAVLIGPERPLAQPQHVRFVIAEGNASAGGVWAAPRAVAGRGIRRWRARCRRAGAQPQPASGQASARPKLSVAREPPSGVHGQVHHRPTGGCRVAGRRRRRRDFPRVLFAKGDRRVCRHLSY